MPGFLALFCRGESFVHSRHGDPGEVFDGLETVAEEAVREVLCVGFERGIAAEGGRDFAAAVEDFDGAGVGRGAVWGFLDFGDLDRSESQYFRPQNTVLIDLKGTIGRTWNYIRLCRRRACRRVFRMPVVPTITVSFVCQYSVSILSRNSVNEPSPR